MADFNSLLGGFLNQPSTILGLSVLNNANRPAAGLLSGLSNYNTLQAQNLNNQAVLSSLQQRAAAERERQQRMAALQTYIKQHPEIPYSDLIGQTGTVQDASQIAGLFPSQGSQPSGIAYALAMGLKPGTPEFNDFVMKVALKPNNSISFGDKPISIPDLGNIADPQGNPYPVGTTYGEAAATGAQYQRMPTAEEAQKIAQTELSSGLLNELKNLVDKKGGPEIGPTAGLKYSALTNRVTAVPAEWAGVKLTEDEAKLISLTEQTGNQLLQAMRGVQVGPAEQKLFDTQLPKWWQPRELFNQNLYYTERNLKYLAEKRKKMRGIVDRTQNTEPTPPPGFTVPIE